MNKTKRYMMLVVALALLAVSLLSIYRAGRTYDVKERRIGIVLTGSAQESGWNGMHYEGAAQACDRMGMSLIVKENVEEYSGQCVRAVKELADEGAEMIFLTSYGYSEEVQELVKEYPNIVFYVNSSEYHVKNMTSYFARMYQARYLSGIIAGMRTESNVIGYVAAMPNNEVNRGINAFTLGVRSVNPEAEVVVIWTGEWDDQAKETAAVDKLIRDNLADVITYHQNQGNVIDEADKAGVDSIGYHKGFTGYSPHYLTSVTCSWDKVYGEIISEYLKGRGNSVRNFWIGIEADAVELTPYSELVTDEIRTEVDRAKAQILSGEAVFSGVIYDREGNLVCSESETISDEALLEHVDWYVEGVEFYEGDMENVD